MPSANVPSGPTPHVIELINRLSELEDFLFDLHEEHKGYNQNLREVEEDEEITEETRECCVYALRSDINSTEDKIYQHQDEVEEISSALKALGYGVEQSDEVINGTG